MVAVRSDFSRTRVGTSGVDMSTRELQLTFFSTGVEETSRAFGRRPRAPKKLKKLNSYTRFCEELC